MKIPLFTLETQHQKLEKELTTAFQRVLKHGRFILGPEVEELEKDIATMCGVPHGIACASGSDALLLALMACDVGPGDEVITSPYSFFATASCAARLGARVIFADIRLEDYNLDPSLVASKFTARTKAIIPVHLFGRCAEMNPWLQEARKRNVVVIEDMAQSLGSSFQKKPAGSMGDMGCISFYPTKNLGGLGDGGLIVTPREDLASRLKILRNHGMHPRYHHGLMGVNSRLDTLQAAFLLPKVPHLAAWAAQRRKNATHYRSQLTAAGLAGNTPQAPLILPQETEGHVFNQYVVRVQNARARDPLRQHLESAGIGTEIYYPIPLHAQACFQMWGYQKGDFPVSELAAASTLALPIFPELDTMQLDGVIQAIQTFNWREYEKQEPVGHR